MPRFLHLRAARALVLFAALALAGTAQATDYVAGVSGDSPALAHGNGNKLEIGRYSSLHAVYADLGVAYYVSSLDADTWTEPVELSAAWEVASLPSVAASGSRVAAVWVEDNGNGYPEVHYGYRTYGSTVWTTSHLVLTGTEPVIALRGSTAYVAWSTGGSIQTTSFPVSSPPGAPLVLGDVVESSNCPNTRFVRPSIALVRRSCATVPKIAYLVQKDEQQTVGACQAAAVQVGPKVESLDAGAWTPVYDGTRTSSAPGSTVEGASLSLNSHYATGNLYLAWSDDLSGNGRTRLVTGREALWATPTAIEEDVQPVHVRANNFSWGGAGSFRLGSEGAWRGGSWLVGGALSLGNFVWPSNLSVRLPQVQFWRKLFAGNSGSATLNVFFEEGPAWPWGGSSLLTDYEAVPFTWVPQGGVLQAHPCQLRSVAIAGVLVGGVSGTVLDSSEIGIFTKVTDRAATITTPDGKTLEVSWTGGRAESFDDTSLVLSAPRASVRVSSRAVAFSLQDDGHLQEYDRVR
jgi:hypothetical protein